MLPVALCYALFSSEPSQARLIGSSYGPVINQFEPVPIKKKALSGSWFCRRNSVHTLHLDNTHVQIPPPLRQNMMPYICCSHRPCTSVQSELKKNIPARYRTENTGKHLVWLSPEFTTSHSVCLILRTHKIKISSQAKLETGGNCESASRSAAGRNQTTTKMRHGM